MKNNIKLPKKHQKNIKKRGFLEKLTAFFNYLIFPENFKCIFCGNDIPNFQDIPYCQNCMKILPFNSEKRCKICDMKITNEANICDFCQKSKRYFKKATCPFIYEGLVRETILAYKNSNKKYLAKGFAVILSKYLNKDNFDLITFVPMTKFERQKRGYNQSELLANELGKILKLPVMSTLKKIKETTPQKALSFNERQNNLKGAFVAENKEHLKGKRILLVDDVITTCATINSCSEKLSKYAKTICVAALARNNFCNSKKI